MIFEWVKWNNHDKDIGATNIGKGFIFIEFNWPITFGCYFHKYDGLPMNGIFIGFFYVGWGITHTWHEDES